jgi:predicted dehydrogenase
MKRRTFLQKSTQTGAAFAAAPLFPLIRPKFQTYRLALIGSGWWGNNILREAVAAGNSKVVGICDVDERALGDTQKNIDEWSGESPKHYRDYRELLQREQPDIVIIATPDHWHALPAIAAMEAGAHVYLEKPIGHTIDEGKAILRTARDTQRVVQVDTHRRVSPHNIAAMELLRSGKVGKISAVKCFVNYGQGPGEPQATTEPPKELDWNFWLGPAPHHDYHPGIHPRGFRQYLDFANGTIGDWGIHWFDQVLWWTEERYPKTAYSHGGRYVRRDNSTAPDTQYAIYEFEDFTLTWEHKLCNPNTNEDHNVGCYFYGTEGVLHLGWLDGFTFYPKNKNASVIHMEPTLHDPDKQNIRELWADFIDAIEEKRRPVCDIRHGQLATNISLLGNLSHKLGRSVEWDGEKERIVGDEEANKLLRRKYRGEWEYPG